MDDRGDARVRQIGVRRDERGDRARGGIRLGQDHGARARFLELPPVAGIREEAEIPRPGAEQRRDMRHPQVRIPAQLQTEAYRQFA